MERGRTAAVDALLLGAGACPSPSLQAEARRLRYGLDPRRGKCGGKLLGTRHLLKLTMKLGTRSTGQSQPVLSNISNVQFDTTCIGATVWHEESTLTLQDVFATIFSTAARNSASAVSTGYTGVRRPSRRG